MVLANILFLNKCCQKRQGTDQLPFKSHITCFPPLYPPLLSSLALERWCKNFKQHQPWCNSTWFTGSWRLSSACCSAEWWKAQSPFSCPDKSQVKAKGCSELDIAEQIGRTEAGENGRSTSRIEMEATPNIFTIEHVVSKDSKVCAKGWRNRSSDIKESTRISLNQWDGISKSLIHAQCAAH